MHIAPSSSSSSSFSPSPNALSMMLSMAVQLQPNVNFCFNTSNFTAQTASKPFKLPFAVRQRTTASSCIPNFHTVFGLQLRRQNFRTQEISASAAPIEAVEAASELLVADDSDSVSSPVKEVSLSLFLPFYLVWLLRLVSFVFSKLKNESLFFLLDGDRLIFGGELPKVW